MNLYKPNKTKHKISNIKMSKSKGNFGELLAIKDYKNHGYKIKDTRFGSDFVATKEIFPGKIYSEIVEVKTGKHSKLSKLQKTTKNKIIRNGGKYTIYHVSDKYYEHALEEEYREKLSRSSLTKKIFNTSQFPGRFLIKDPTSCPNCRCTAEGIVSIFVVFGLRNMENNTVIVQSWCRECRHKSRRNNK